LPTNSLFPRQFDILTILVVTAAVAVGCALARSPLRVDLKVLAISIEVSFFLGWALWYYQELRTAFPAIFGLVPWSGYLALGIYQTYGPARGWASMLPVLLIGFSAAMLLRQVFEIRKVLRAHARARSGSPQSDVITPTARKPDFGWILASSLLVTVIVFSRNVWGSYRMRGYLEFSTSQMQLAILLLVATTVVFIYKAAQGRKRLPKKGQV